MDFKTSVRDKLIKVAIEYKKITDCDFVLSSDLFVYKKEYILRFYNDNFLHLTGVITNLSANLFFDKCIKQTISIDDFVCDSTSELKGKVKEKLKNLSDIGNFFDKELIFQEKFEKNRVKCNIASSDGKCTLGFINTKGSVHVPLTILNKNQISKENGIVIFTIRKKFK